MEIVPGGHWEVLQEEIRGAVQEETVLETRLAVQRLPSSQPIRPRMQLRGSHPKWIHSRQFNDLGIKY